MWTQPDREEVRDLRREHERLRALANDLVGDSDPAPACVVNVGDVHRVSVPRLEKAVATKPSATPPPAPARRSAAGPRVRIVAAHLLDEALGVVAVDKGLDGITQRKVRREGVVNDGVDDHEARLFDRWE